MFGEWSVVSSEAKREKGYRLIYVRCTTCGNAEWKHYDNLKRGLSLSCLKCSANKRRYIPEEWKWLERRYNSIKQRCENEKDRWYCNYGARGIRLEFSSFQSFWDYCRTLPSCSSSLEIDRIDNNGNYAVGNLRFVSRAENNRNRRTNVLVEWEGKAMVFSDFVRDYTNLSAPRARKLYRQGLSLQELHEYKPQARGRRAQNIRLGRLRRA